MRRRHGAALMTAMLYFDELALGLQLKYAHLTHHHRQQSARTSSSTSISTSSSASSSSSSSSSRAAPLSATAPSASLTPTPFEAPPDDEPTKLIDIGANLLDPMFSGNYHGKQKHEPDLRKVLERAAEQGVAAILVTAGTLEDSRAAQAFIDENNAALAEAAAAVSARDGGSDGGGWGAAGCSAPPPKLYTTVGVHPTHCLEFRGGDGEGSDWVEGGASDGGEAAVAAHVAALDALADHKGVVAVGELGLDYDRLHFCPAAQQMEGFLAQLPMASRTGKPLFLHSRNAGKDMHAALSAARSSFGDGVVHSFDGSVEELEGLLDLGLFVGLNGCSLRTEENLEAVKRLPLERLLLETDAPWCEIKPTHAGFGYVETKLEVKKKPDKFEWGMGVKNRCEPWMMRQVLEVVAAVKGVPQDVVARHAHFNARRVFKLPL